MLVNTTGVAVGETLQSEKALLWDNQKSYAVFEISSVGFPAMLSFRSQH